MKKKRIIILNEIINLQSYDYNILAAFQYDTAVDDMTQYFNEIAGYETKMAEAIVDKLLGTLYEDISEVIEIDDMAYQCIISELYEK